MKRWYVRISHRSGLVLEAIVLSHSRVAAEDVLYERPGVPIDCGIWSKEL